MAPRQRTSSQSTVEGSPGRPLLSPTLSSSSEDSSSSSSSSNNRRTRTTNPSPKSTSKQQSGVPLTEADIAREHHDIFNILALPFVVITTLINWNYMRFLQGYGPEEAWTGTYFYWNWVTTILYFLVDLVWVSRVPICVKSPGTIVKHHIVVIAYLSAPMFWPEFRWFMGACLTVELNTWFLILRRVVYKRKQQISPILVEAVSMCFYASWILIRCVIYPAIFFYFLYLARVRVEETQRLWHWPMVFIPVHFFLCVLNLKWSYDLFEPIIRRWSKRLRGERVETANAVSNGL